MKIAGCIKYYQSSLRYELIAIITANYIPAPFGNNFWSMTMLVLSVHVDKRAELRIENITDTQYFQYFYYSLLMDYENIFTENGELMGELLDKMGIDLDKLVKYYQQ